MGYTDPLYTSGKYPTPDVYNVLLHSCEYRAEYGILLLELIKVGARAQVLVQLSHSAYQCDTHQ